LKVHTKFSAFNVPRYVGSKAFLYSPHAHSPYVTDHTTDTSRDSIVSHKFSLL
jgi:hypothetical protein